MYPSIKKRSLTYIIATIPLLIGISVLIGWHTHYYPLIQVGSQYAPMQYNTALCFLLLGGGLCFALANESGKWTSFAGWIIASIGFLTLTEYIFNIDLFLDQLFMEHYITVETSHPGRMAPNTALCFVFSGISLILIQKRFHKISGFIGSVVFGLGLVSVVGYFLGVQDTYKWGEGNTSMAIHTSIGFIFSGATITTLSLINKLVEDISLRGYIFSLIITVFLIDIESPLGVANGIPYVLATLSCYFIKNTSFLYWVALITTLLTIVGLYLSPTSTAEEWVVITNRVFAVCMIWITSFLVVIIKKKEDSLNNLNVQLNQKVELIQHQKADLERYNDELKQFAYVASHDLQEPLRVITSYLELLQRKYKDLMDEKGNQYIARTIEATNRMKKLINDLLILSRVESKPTNHEPIPLNELITAVEEDMEIFIKENNAKIIRKDLPEIKGDPTQLYQLFQNLINNGIKFNNSQERKIEIAAKKISNEMIEFSIKDNGIGIDQKYIDRIFIVFQRLHTRSEYSGTGIGLALCKKIVEQHNGKIHVESIPNQGSTFHFTLPAA